MKSENTLFINDNKDKEKILVLIIIILVFPVILFTTGTIMSGWHLVDDHETYRIVCLNVKEKVPFYETFKQYLFNDLEIRWRPLYWVFRIAFAYIFGLNSVLPNIFVCVLGMITYVLFYDTARKLSCSKWSAHLFSMLILVGRQYEIWYRISNQENIGILLFALCMWLIVRQHKEKGYEKRKYDFCIGASAIMCALMKESFLLLLPGIVFFRLGLENISVSNIAHKWYKVIKKNIILCVICAFVFALSVFAIFFHVGTNSIGYAGIDTDSEIKVLIWNILRLCKDSLFYYVIIAGVITAVCLIPAYRYFRKSSNKAAQYFLLELTFGFYIMGTQIILYAKSGMWDRYLVPFLAGFGFVFVILADKVLSDKYRKLIYRIIFVVFLIYNFKFAIFNMAYNYASEGRAIQSMISVVKENSTPDSYIVTALGQEERDMAVSIYLEFDERKQVYIYDETKNIWQDGYGSIETGLSKDEAREKTDILILDQRNNNEELINAWINNSEWKKEQIDKWFELYIKKSE